MPDLILPAGVESEKPEEKPEKVLVRIIRDLREVTVDEQELAIARKAYNSKSAVLVMDDQLRVGLQREIAGWANWLALAYPRLPKTLENALGLVGYKLIKVEESEVT